MTDKPPYDIADRRLHRPAPWPRHRSGLAGMPCRRTGRRFRRARPASGTGSPSSRAKAWSPTLCRRSRPKLVLTTVRQFTKW